MKYTLHFFLEDDEVGSDSFVSLLSEFLPPIGEKIYIPDEYLAEAKDARHPNGYRVIDRRFLIGKGDGLADGAIVFEVIVEPTS